MIIVKFSKKLRAADIEQYAQRLVSNPFFDPSFSEIVDLTEVEEVELRGDDLLRLADHIDPFSFDSKRAFVVKDAKQSHQARMYQISRLSKDNIRAVRSIDEAKRWIVGGVPPRD